MIGHKGRIETPQFFRLISNDHGKLPLPRYLLLAQFLVVTVVNATGLTSKDICEKEWTQLQTDSRFASNTSKVKQFESYAPSCAGSGLYEVQLSQLYLEANDLAKAKQPLENALKQNMPHRRELLFKEAVVYLLNQDLTKAQDTFQTLIKDYPDSYDVRHRGRIYGSTVLLSPVDRRYELYC
jgi:tetratricopeptide (TPR) repeat protein